jgi:DNA-binding transcriptional MerR regulator
MSWSIAQVARMSNVTSRTLRHYDDIGLLRPAHVAASGYRYYEREQLLRLQEILLLRELGLGLEAIGRTLDGAQDALDALRQHHRSLLAERDRYEQLAATVAKTITELEGGDNMPAEQLFAGFDHSQYEEEVAERWGHTEAYAESKRNVAAMTPADAERIQAEQAEVESALVELLDAGVPAGDERTLDVVDRHYRWFCNFWTPDRTAFTCVGKMYVDDERFKVNYDSRRPGLAEYLRDAMAAYAQARL